MNINATDFPANARLHQIKFVSRIAKLVCYGAFIYSIGFFLLYTAASFFSAMGRGSLAILMALLQIGLWVAYLKLRQSPQVNERFRLGPLMALVQLFLWLGYWKMLSKPVSPDQGWHNWLSVLYQMSIWVWYWKLARLFRCYEQGLIFAEKTIRCIKILGLLCVTGWLLGTVSHFATSPLQFAGPPETRTITHTEHTTYTTIVRTHYIGFFSFDFGTGINFGPFFIGVIIVLIAWIMDEGRKIQEEQALTV